MANQEQLKILKQGVEAWNSWRAKNVVHHANLKGAHLNAADLRLAKFWNTDLTEADLSGADLSSANLNDAQLLRAKLTGANLTEANLRSADLSAADLSQADLGGANLKRANLRRANFIGSNFLKARLGATIFGNSDLSKAIALEEVVHRGPSNISTDVFALSKGQVPEVFLRGCGLSDADIEYSKLSNPNLTNDDRSKILYKIYDLQASQSIQVSPLFVSYSHNDSQFVDKIGNNLTKKGIRFWRDIHEMKSGRMERQIDIAIRQNPTVLLVLSEHSLSSDWVEHEVRTARGLEKEIGRDILCPVALDDSWKSSPWPRRVMEQIMEYNILDFSAWKNDSKFDGMFRKLIDGLELFYKG